MPKSGVNIAKIGVFNAKNSGVLNAKIMVFKNAKKWQLNAQIFYEMDPWDLNNTLV